MARRNAPSVDPRIQNCTDTMKIATWNVNSVRARLERLLALLRKFQPDILCLQELKGRKDAFPYKEIQAAGYPAAVCGHGPLYVNDY